MVYALLRLPRGSNKRDDTAVGRAPGQERKREEEVERRREEGRNRERDRSRVLGQYVPKLFYFGRQLVVVEQREGGDKEREKGKQREDKNVPPCGGPSSRRAASWPAAE